MPDFRCAATPVGRAKCVCTKHSFPTGALTRTCRAFISWPALAAGSSRPLKMDTRNATSRHKCVCTCGSSSQCVGVLLPPSDAEGPPAPSAACAAEGHGTSPCVRAHTVASGGPPRVRGLHRRPVGSRSPGHALWPPTRSSVRHRSANPAHAKPEPSGRAIELFL